MQRRDFIKNSIVTSTGLMLFPALNEHMLAEKKLSNNDLEKYFLDPPASAKPWCFWMWMNGNITKEGLTADLEAMHRMGIGGAINFNSAVGIPRGPVDYAGETWMDATVHAIREAERLGIELALHNAPGYSGCGGPWVTPEMSMQQLVWTETLINSTGVIDVILRRPYAKQDYYRDAFVIAYPSLPVEKALMKDKLVNVILDGNEIDKNIIIDDNPETKIRLGPKQKNNSTLLLSFAEPFEARAISILRKPETPHDLYDGPRDHPPVIRLEYSANNVQFNFIGNINCPELREMDTPAVLGFDAVSAKYFKLSVNSPTWISEIELHNGPRLGGWPGKTNFTHGSTGGDTFGISEATIIDADKVEDISTKMNASGRLQWNAPAGAWTILRIGHTTTGEECAAHPDAGKGLEIDKLRKEALDLHFSSFLDKLIARVKPNIGKGLKGITVDSWEAGKQNWTKNFPEAFKQLHNYDIIKWMPALTGRIVNSTDATERFLWDFRKTHADMLAENFYGYYAECCHKRGLEFYAEPYGDGTLDNLKISQHLDIPMSEFWTRYIYGSDGTSKQAAAAAHIYGKKIVAAESYTAMPATAKWTDYPYSLKAEGDYFFSLGVNRLTFHTFVHQPYMTGKPGMTMGPFGMHIDRNNTWTEQAYGWTNYIQRAQYLLQQGLTVADACYFKGDEPDPGIPDLSSILPAGYAGDIFGSDALRNRLSIKDKKIVLPDGMHYQYCIMAPLISILPSSLNKLKGLVAQGMTLIVTNKPSKTYGQAGSDNEIQLITDELYKDLDGKSVTARTYGKGKIVWQNDYKKMFSDTNIEPDFNYTAANQDAAIHYMHKVIGDTEFYFVTNHRRRKENIVCSFRITDKQPEIWNAESGVISNAVLYEMNEGRTTVPLELSPAGSIFIVFRKKTSTNGFKSILQNGKELITTTAFRAPVENLYGYIQNNFSIVAWIKPDTFAHGGRSMLFHAPQAAAVYGEGHSAVAIAAGQNIVRVYERSRGVAKEILNYNNPIEGWTLIVLVYNDGKPSLFVNGKFAVTANASGAIVHPGMDTPASPEQFSSFFEGNYTAPNLYNEILKEDQIIKLFNEGLPKPSLPAGMQLIEEKKQLKALIWENGNYSLHSATGTKQIGNITGCKSVDVAGEWKIVFPTDSGAPHEIVLSSLISLHKHNEFNVKYFAGTCVYSKTMLMGGADLQQGKKIFLHLGRVEVVAEVKVNGIVLGISWKEPFIIEITKAVKTGNNIIEIAVTNLWPNRLIGDENLPVENEFTKDNLLKTLPGWFVNNQPKPGQRISFATWHVYEKDSPLMESGLLGPVRLLTAIEKISLWKNVKGYSQ